MSNTTVNSSVPMKKYKKRSQLGEIWHRFRKNKGALLGGLIILVLIVLALLSDVIYDYETDIIGQNISQRFIKPCWEHPFGTDNFGRDLLARVIYGARSSLPVGFVAVLVSLFLGIVLGALAGFLAARLKTSSCASWTSSPLYPTSLWPSLWSPLWAPAHSP